MKINIRTIPHDKQRYETCGDYWTDSEGRIKIVVSDMGNDDYAFLVGLHEMVEYWLVKKRGINEQSITDFDIKFDGKGEPGDDPEAPYQKEHNFATGIERLMCSELGIKWQDYDGTVGELFHE